MKSELEAKLIEDFPWLFRESTLPCTQTCLCWGCECGDGWFDVIYDMCKEIKNIDTERRVSFTQIKEKFGTLRVYYTTRPSMIIDDEEFDDKIFNIIMKADNRSSITCEDCGKPGKTVGVNWLMTLCEECEESRINAR